MILKDLDDRLVPRMAAGLRRALDRATPSRPATPEGEEPTSGGFMGLLRDVPQLAALMAAVVFLGVAGVFLLVRSGEDRTLPPPSAPPGSIATSPTAAPVAAPLGPPVGTQIDSYLAQAAARTARVSAQDPDGRRLGLVLLADYVTIADAASLLTEVEARGAYLRAQTAGELAEVFEVPIPTDLTSTLRSFFAATTAAKQEDATEFQGLADSIVETSAEEAAAKQAYVADAQRSSAEAAAYGADCACVFTLVVEGTTSALAALAADPRVRGVEPADRAARLETLEVYPLQPEHTGVVPAPAIPGEEQ